MIYGAKSLDGNAAAAGSFSFQLWEGDTLLQTKQVLDGGAILFDPIVYESQGQHVYTIREVVDDDDETLTYDRHDETVTVLVQQVNGGITALVEYDADGVTFENRSNPGNLRLEKQVTGQTEANADDEFEFKVTLRNSDGQPLTDGVYIRYGSR